MRNPDLAGEKGEVRVYCKGAPDFFLMEDTDPSGEITYPEMKYVQSERTVHNLDDTTNVPEELLVDGGPSNDSMLNIYKRTIRLFA